MSSPKRILYAPTWEGFYEDSCYCSLLRMGPQILDTLTAERGRYVLHFKPHPLTGTNDSRYAAAQNAFAAKAKQSGNSGMVMEPDKTLYDYFLETDLLITDISGVVSDFIYLDRPLIVANPLAIVDMEQQFPVVRGCYILEPDPFNASALLDDALTEDSKRAARRATRDHIFGVPRNGAMAAFNASMSQIAPGSLVTMLARQLDEIIDRVVKTLPAPGPLLPVAPDAGNREEQRAEYDAEGEEEEPSPTTDEEDQHSPA